MLWIVDILVHTRLSNDVYVIYTMQKTFWMFHRRLHMRCILHIANNHHHKWAEAHVSVSYLVKVSLKSISFCLWIVPRRRALLTPTSQKNRLYSSFVRSCVYRGRSRIEMSSFSHHWPSSSTKTLNMVCHTSVPFPVWHRKAFDFVLFFRTLVN